MRRLLAFLALCAGLALLPGSPVYAQSTTGVVVATCGTPPSTYTAGQSRLLTQNTAGRVCQDATATISGTVAATQSGTWSVQGMQAQGASPSGNPNQIGLFDSNDGFVYRAKGAFNGMNIPGTGLGATALGGQCDETSPTAITENQFGNARINCADHGLLVHEMGNSFTNITTATDTVIKASVGVLVGLTINTGGAGSSAVIYNNTTCTGAKIGTYSTAAQAALSIPPISASVGICVTTTGGTPADITVIWR